MKLIQLFLFITLVGAVAPVLSIDSQKIKANADSLPTPPWTIVVE